MNKTVADALVGFDAMLDLDGITDSRRMRLIELRTILVYKYRLVNRIRREWLWWLSDNDKLNYTQDEAQEIHEMAEYGEQVRANKGSLRAESELGDPVPPINAEFLFHLLMTPQNCDALVGDLEERYKLIFKKFGRRRANIWYWTQTVTSVGPIVWAWAKRVVLKPVMALVGWAVANHFLNDNSWLAMLVELVKKVRS